MRIEFTIPAVPVAQPRPRAVTIAGRSRIVSNPVKHPVTAFKATARLAAQQIYEGPPLEGPLQMYVQFIMPRPRDRVWKRQAMPRYAHTARPDCDNLIKSVLDAFLGLLWHDDAQVSSLCVHKMVASGDEQPHVEVVLQQEA